MHCRASWGNSFAWAAVIAFGILGAAIAEGANASPNRRSRSADPSIAHPNPLNSLLKEDIGDLSQCTNYDYPGKAAPAELEIEGASHRRLLTATGAPSHKLSSVLQHMIPRKSFLAAPVPYAAPQVALISNPSTPSPSSGLQVASPYASTPLFSPSLSQPTASPVTPAATAPAAVQMPPPSSSESPPLPSGTSIPVAMLSPLPGVLPTPVESTAAKPAALTASPAVPSSPATTPVTSAPMASPSTASPSSPGTSDSTSTNAPASPSSPAAPLAAFPSVNAPSGPTGAMSSPNANSNASPSQLQFALIPFGFRPLVTAQATFQAIPASSLTLLQVAEVASDLQQALANVASGSVPVTAVVTPINIEAAAAAPLPGRRHLLQAGNTLQATVLFTVEFATAPGGNTDVQAAVQAAAATAVAPLIVTTRTTSIGPGSYNVEIVFPANNQVSSSASQGTLAATTFLAGLRSSPTTQLAGLAASAGSFTVATSEIQTELVTLSPGLVPPAASPALPSPLPLPTPDATSAPTSPAVMSPSLPAAAPPVAEPTPSAASEPVPTSTADANAAPAGPTPTQATSPAGNVSPVLGTPPGSSQPPPPLTPPTPDAVQPSPPSPTVAALTASPPREPTSAATVVPTTEPPAASPISTPNPAEAAPQATPLSPLLTMNLSVAFPPIATAAAQDLTNMLYKQSQRDLYAVVDRNGPISFSNVVYGSQLIPTPILSLAPVPAPGPGPETSTAALPAAAAPESAPSAATVESYSGSDADGSSSAASGQLYAINMQYGVGGARTNAVANLLVFSLNSSGPPRATDFAVQLGDPAQTGNVSVLSTYSSPSDYLIRVDCPEGYTGLVTVGYASPMIQAVNYSVTDSALLVKVTASTGTQQ